MTMKWKPDLANPELEREMESKDLPEEDRDQVRGFVTFLRRRKAKKEGKDLPPAPEGLKKFLTGEDSQ